MKKITYQAAMAFFNGQDYKNDNTEVTASGLQTILRLHGNAIAWRTPGENRLFITLAGWNTVTTRERLNGLLSYYSEQKHWKCSPAFSTSKGQARFRQGEHTYAEGGKLAHVANNWLNIDSTTILALNSRTGKKVKA